MKKLLILSFFLTTAISSSAVIITVDWDGSGDYTTIQDGINAAVSGQDTVIVTEGIYVENISFGGKDIVLRSIDPNDPAVVAATIIDGNDLTSVVTFDGTETSDCLLTGFTITGGKKGVPMYVDLQPEGGDVEPGWIEWDPDLWVIDLIADFDDDFSATLDYGIPIDNGDWQTEYPPGPLMIADVLEDGYRRFGVITLTFSNLNAGDYFIVTYHVDMTHTGGVLSSFRVFVDGQIAHNFAETVGRDSFVPVEGSIGFSFTSNGTDDVVIEFDGTAVHPEDDEVWLNGFGLMGLGPLCGGGGIAGNSCSATITKCVIRNNWANDGAGIYDCDGLIESNIIRDNVAADILPPGPVGAIGSGGGLYDCDGTIAKNTISGNGEFAGGGLIHCNGIITNNLLVDNTAVYGGALCECNGIISNCTAVGNPIVAIKSCSGTITNCIIWQNHLQLSDCSIPSYSCIEDWTGGGIGNIDAAPDFVDPNNGDYHLKSQAGRWDPNTESWVIDDVTSPCIDAGNPGCPLGDELSDPNNVRINIGIYGGTAEASKTPVGWGLLADINNNWVVDFPDLLIFGSYWLDSGECIPSDLDRSQTTDSADFAWLSGEWLNVRSVAKAGVSYQIQDCDPGAKSTVGDKDALRFSATVDGNYILFEDIMVANCCKTEVWLEMTVEDNLITLYELEYTPMPCYCICDFPITATLGPFASGTYTLDVYEDWGGFIGSTIVSIE